MQVINNSIEKEHIMLRHFRRKKRPKHLPPSKIIKFTTGIVKAMIIIFSKEVVKQAAIELLNTVVG